MPSPKLELATVLLHWTMYQNLSMTIYNNRKKLDNDSVRKDNVSKFKRSKRQKIC